MAIAIGAVLTTKYRQGHPRERPGRRHQVDGRRGTAEPPVHLPRSFGRDDEDRDVEQRAVERVAAGCRLVERRLGQPARGGHDHARVRPPQDEGRDVHDVRHGHVRAAGDGEVDLERRCQRGEDDEEQERGDRRQRRAGHERGERDGAGHDDADRVPAGSRRKIPKHSRISIHTGGVDTNQTSVLYRCFT